MGALKVGFSRVNVTPHLGIRICGYYKDRFAEGVLDELEANAIAFEKDGVKAVMMCVDHLGLNQKILSKARKAVAEATGLAIENVFVSATHTHTGPEAALEHEEKNIVEYTEYLSKKIVDAAVLALADLKDAKMGFGVGHAPNVAFVRRFRMKDGSIKTNPGVNNPDIVEPIGNVDERVNVIRFDRVGAETVVVVNFGNHPDVVGGSKISADWPGLVRSTVEKCIDNTKCVFFNGAQGDVNHVNVHPTGGYLNDMFMDFDDVARGYEHSKYIARVVTGGVLQAYDKVEYTDVDSIKCINRPISVASAMPTAEELPEAYKIKALHEAGKDDEIPFEGMMLTTVVAEALRMVRLENGPESFDMLLSGIKIGPVAFVGIPGEPFNGIGLAIKDTEGFGLILPVCAANGYEGYFPMKDAYDEGGYEARTSAFKAGCAEYIISEGKQLLGDLKR